VVRGFVSPVRSVPTHPPGRIGGEIPGCASLTRATCACRLPPWSSRVSLGAIGGNGIGRPHPVDADRVAEWLGSRGRGAGDAQVPALSRGQRGKAAGV